MAASASRPRCAARILAAAVLLASAWSSAVRSYETDQYSNRGAAIRDARPELDELVNRTLAEIAGDWRGGADRYRFAHRVYRRLGGHHWVDRIERWAMKSPRVDKLPQSRYRSVYRGAPVYASRVNFFFGIGRTIRIDRTLLGTDKLGHFFSQGLKYYRRRLQGMPEESVLRRGAFSERWIFGQATTSVYSNADLVANFEGYRFYRSLFEDGVVEGKPAIVAFRDGRAVVQRPFDWRDYVNDYWDEALHPSHLSPGLQRYFARVLPRFCDDYRGGPGKLALESTPALEARYRQLGLRAAPENRLDRVCAPRRAGDRVAAGG
jgi:hypothetical protein